MTDAPKLIAYLFFRKEGFYPIGIAKEGLADNIHANPGTLRVEEVRRDGTPFTVWTAALRWVSPEYQELFGSPQ